ncbi:MAG TPA: hypothetical protein VIF62_36300, partial [Labilithrix sp.]
MSSRASTYRSLALAALFGCARAHADPSISEPNIVAESLEPGSGETPTTTSALLPLPEKPPPDGMFVFATTFIAPIFSATEWPARDTQIASDDRKGVVRLGYLRHGARAVAKKDPIKKGNCPESWYALVGGGYVCGKYLTTDEHAKELKTAPHAPFLDRPLPYDYAMNLTPGTPLYRRLPLRRERRENEKDLAIGKGAKASDVAKRLKEAGEEVPAYLKDVESTNKPHVAFDDLKGESGLVVQRMLRGFYLSVDSGVEGTQGRFWRTTQSFYAPKDHVILHEMKTEFEGVELASEAENGRETRKLPLAWVVGTRGRRCDVDMSADKKVTRHELLPRFSTYHLTGKNQKIDDRFYWETD